VHRGFEVVTHERLEVRLHAVLRVDTPCEVVWPDDGGSTQRFLALSGSSPSSSGTRWSYSACDIQPGQRQCAARSRVDVVGLLAHLPVDLFGLPLVVAGCSEIAEYALLMHLMAGVASSAQVNHFPAGCVGIYPPIVIELPVWVRSTACWDRF
jgi:hypothetical protein